MIQRDRVMALIPALNAEAMIGEIVRQCRHHVDRVVVVDDGSRDATGDVARSCGATVLHHSVNRGKGAALKTGFRYAVEQGFDGVVTLDADGQHLPSEIPKILGTHRNTGADLVIGDRAHLFEEMLARRRFANRLSAGSISWAAGTPVRDSQSGFRFYSARLLRSLHLHADGFDMESEVIVRAARNGFGIATAPIELGFIDGQSTSHYKPLADSLRIAWTVFRARFLWR